MVRGQMLVAAALMMAIVIMSIVVSVYEAHVFFLKTRSVVVREVVGAITADFERALAATLAVATRGYYNYTRFRDLCAKFGSMGYSPLEKHNFTVARIMAHNYLQYWRTAVARAYAGYGLQVDYEVETLDITHLLGRRRYVYNISAGYWYYPSAASVAHARLKVNLTNLGFYGWESPVTVGVFLRVQPEPIEVNQDEGWMKVRINVRVDDGEPYPLLITQGWIEIYYPREDNGRWTGEWAKAKILDVSYEGCGNYTITISPIVEVLEDPLTGEKYAPLLVVVSDHRGILVEAVTYDHIVFKIRKRTPDTLEYYKENGKLYSISRPQSTPHEVYTIEFSSDLRLFWLDMELPVDPDLKIPPLPFMPIKQLLVNVSRDGTLATLRERPLQYENWTLRTWHDRQVWIPYGLPDPTTDIRPYVIIDGNYYTIRFVFQVPFPRLGIKEQYVVIWWNDSLDAKPKAWGTGIRYEYDPSRGLKDLVHPELRIELIDTEHTCMRGYVDYGGVAALGLRSPSGEAFGPWNIHAFGVFCQGWWCYLGRFRPYGRWEVYSHYLGRYSWMKAPIRIFAVLETDLVASVYEGDPYYGNPTTGYYSTLAILEVINGTRYIPLILHVHWQEDREDYSYWLYSMMGAGVPEKFAYMTGWKADGLKEGTVRERSYSWPCPAEWGSCSGCYHTGFMAPGSWSAHWNSAMGRGVVGNENLVELLRKSEALGYTPAFYVTRCGGPTGTQNSLEVKLADGWINVRRDDFNPLLDYWLVLTMFDPPSLDEGWKGLYYYAPMFWEAYAPEVVPP